MARTADTIDKTETVTLDIRGLRASVEGKEILKGIDLTVRQGEVHALMGPNGSGKSTLAHVLMGRPGYQVTGGEIRFKGQNITALKPDQRAQLGLFLAFQYPTEIPGVSSARRTRRSRVTRSPRWPSASGSRRRWRSWPWRTRWSIGT